MKKFNRSKRHPFPIFSGRKIDLKMFERKINTELTSFSFFRDFRGIFFV